MRRLCAHCLDETYTCPICAMFATTDPDWPPITWPPLVDPIDGGLASP
jgi:hypothetical protein